MIATSGRDVFTSGLYFFTRRLYFFTSGRYVLVPRISHLVPRTSKRSHFIYNSQFVLSLYIVVLTRKHPTHPTLVTPKLGVGSVASVGYFPLSLS